MVKQMLGKANSLVGMKQFLRTESTIEGLIVLLEKISKAGYYEGLAAIMSEVESAVARVIVLEVKPDFVKDERLKEQIIRWFLYPLHLREHALQISSSIDIASLLLTGIRCQKLKDDDSLDDISDLLDAFTSMVLSYRNDSLPEKAEEKLPLKAKVDGKQGIIDFIQYLGYNNKFTNLLESHPDPIIELECGSGIRLIACLSDSGELVEESPFVLTNNLENINKFLLLLEQKVVTFRTVTHVSERDDANLDWRMTTVTE